MSDPTNPSKPNEALLDENNPGQVREHQLEDNEVPQEGIQEQYQGQAEEYEYPAQENEEQQEVEQQNNEEEHSENAEQQDMEAADAEAEHENTDEHQEDGQEEQPQTEQVNEEQAGQLLNQNNQDGQKVDIPAQEAEEEYPTEVQYLEDGQHLNDGIDNHFQSTIQPQHQQLPIENNQEKIHSPEIYHEELIEEGESLPHQVEENQTQPEIEHQYINQQIHEQLRIDDIYLTSSQLHGERIKQTNPMSNQQISFIGLEQTAQPERTTSIIKQQPSSLKSKQPDILTQPQQIPPAFTVFVKKQIKEQVVQKPVVKQKLASSPKKPVILIQKTTENSQRSKESTSQPILKQQKIQIVKVKHQQSKIQRSVQPKQEAFVKQVTKKEIKPIEQQKNIKETSPSIVKKKKKKVKIHDSSLPADSKVIKIEEKRQTFKQIKKPIKQQTIPRQINQSQLKQIKATSLQSVAEKRESEVPIASPPPPPLRESLPVIAPAVQPPPVALNRQAIPEPGIEDHPPLTSLIIIKEAEKERVGTTYNMFLKYNYDYDRAVNNYKRIVSSICLQLERQKNSKKKLINLLTDYFEDYAKVNREFHQSVYKIQTIEPIPFSPNRFGNIKVELKTHFEELIFLRKSIANDSHKIDVYITTQVLPNIKKVFEAYYAAIGAEERRQIQRRQHHYKREKIWRKLVSQLDKNFNRGMQGKQKDDIFSNIIRFVNQQKIHRDALRNYGRGLIDLRQTYIRCEKELFDHLQYILNQFKTLSKTVYSVGRSIFDSIADLTHEIQKMTKFSDICALTDLDYIKYVLELHSKSSADDFKNKHFGMYLDLVYFDRVVGNIRDLYKGATNKIFPMEYQGDELIHTISGNLVHFNRERDEFRDKFVICNINAKIIGQGIVEFDQVIKGIIFDDNRTIRLRLKDADRAEELICYLNSKEENIIVDPPVSART